MVGRLGRVTTALLVVTLSGCMPPHRMFEATPGICPGALQSRATQPPDSSALRWFRAAEERDARMSSAWCETVGAPELKLTPPGNLGAWGTRGSLHVGSWNMALGGGDIYAFLRAEFGLTCAGAGRPHPSTPAPIVILLQETWRASDNLPLVGADSAIPWTIDTDREAGTADDVTRIADRCGLALVYVPSARNGPDTDTRPREDKGNAILSTLPLLDPLALDLPFEGGRKVAVAASVRGPDGALVQVVSSHLDVASTLYRSLLTGNQTRVRQTLGLIAGIDAANRIDRHPDAVLVGGDFNTWAGNEASLKIMHRDFPHSPEWDGLGTRGSFPTDHIFFRRSESTSIGIDAYRRVENTYGSDHNARRATLVHRSP